MTAAAMNDNVTEAAQEWWTAAEFAELGLPGVPNTERGVRVMIDRVGGNDACRQWSPENPLGIWRKRKGRGGGREYRMDVLPTEARAALALRLQRAAERRRVKASGPQALSNRDIAKLWRWYEALPASTKAKAEKRLFALAAVAELQVNGRSRDQAMMDIAAREDIGLTTLYGWAALVGGIDRQDWLPLLAPRHRGRLATADCTPEAWDFFLGLYRTTSEATLNKCYRDLVEAAKKHGWIIPSKRTIARRYAALPTTTQVLGRKGQKAHDKLYPAMQRDKTMLEAMEAVNSDGRKADVFVRWEDGETGRPTVVAYQDIYSGMILSWRVSRGETSQAVLLTFGDMAEEWGLPERCLFDNGRAFAAKSVTGGARTRYRFKVRPDDMAGVLTILGVKTHWAKPNHGQSKPIERAWRDLASNVDRDPRFAGAFTGNNPNAKPEDYGSRAIPIADYRAVLDAAIHEHNNRPGRESKVCRGRLSFAEAFAASYETAIVRKPRPEHALLWTLQAEGVMARSKDGSIHFMGNRFWDDALLDHLGSKVVIRFDTDNLHGGVHVYDLDGRYISFARCLDDIGVFDAEKGGEYLRRMGAKKKAAKRAAQVGMPTEQAVALMAPVEPAAKPEARVIRPVRAARAGNLALKPEIDRQANEDAFARGLRRLHLVPTKNAADD